MTRVTTPGTTSGMTPGALVEAACPRVQELGSAFYFVPETLAAGRGLGLDGFRFYFLGRGGALGDVEAGVVGSAFGYFEPSLVERIWSSGSAVVPPRTAGRAWFDCAAALGRARFTGIAGLDRFCAAADAVVDAADPVGLALYAAVAAEQRADDPPARAMQLLTVLREFRGSAHLIALRAVGLDALVAHAVRRPDDLALFGWDESALPEITDAHRAAWHQAEELTDRMCAVAYGVLDDDGRQTFVAGLDAIETALAAPA